MRLVDQLGSACCMSPRPTELLLIIGFELLIYGCVQHLKRRLPLRQITFRNKFGVQATVDELPVQ